MVCRCWYGGQRDNVDTSLLVLFSRRLPYKLIWIRPCGYVDAMSDGCELSLFEEEHEKDERQRKYNAERAIAPSPALSRSLRARTHGRKEALLLISMCPY